MGDAVIGDLEPGSTPQAVFLVAQAAVRHGDWATFYPLLVRRDLEQLAERGVMASTNVDGEFFRNVCLQHGIPADDLDHLQRLARQVSESAERILHGGNLEAEDAMMRAVAHRELLRAQSAAVATCVSALNGLAAFVADTERLRLELDGAGSLSATIFLDETLLNVTVNGNRAIGIRRRPLGVDEPITFECLRGSWRIQLFDAPPA